MGARDPGIALSPYRRLTFSLVFAVLLAGQTVAGPARDGSVDAYVRGEMAKRRIPGLALAVIQHGHIETISSYGRADLAFDIPVTSSTLFNVAPISKAFTAVNLMTLIESGRLRLDDHVGAYLDQLPPSRQDVTIRQLLNHTSGLPDIAVNQYTTDTVANSPQEAIQALRDRPMDFVPGGQYRYNQSSYMLLGLLIEKLSGQPYSKIL